MWCCQYLEALSWQGAQHKDRPPELAPWRPLRVAVRTPSGEAPREDGEAEEEVDMEEVVSVLKQLEGLCSRQVWGLRPPCRYVTLHLYHSPVYNLARYMCLHVCLQYNPRENFIIH